MHPEVDNGKKSLVVRNWSLTLNHSRAVSRALTFNHSRAVSK
jgi:hypothetical protein